MSFLLAGGNKQRSPKSFDWISESTNLRGNRGEIGRVEGEKERKERGERDGGKHHHHHHFRLLSSADTRNLIYMSKQYKPTCNLKVKVKVNVDLYSALS